MIIMELQEIKIELLGRFLEVLEELNESKKNITNELDRIEDIEDVASNEGVTREYIFIFNQLFGYTLDDIKNMIKLSKLGGLKR